LIDDYQEYIKRTTGFRGSDNRTKYVKPSQSYSFAKPHLQPPLSTIPERKVKFNPPLELEMTPEKMTRPRTAAQSGGKKVRLLDKK
jgi:hypothetical protein